MQVKRVAAVLLISSMLLAGLFGMAAAAPSENACWGQATKVYTQQEPGLLGEHSSEQPVPRVGLRNLARSLESQGIIEDDSMQALGQFVANELDLTVEACQ